MRAHLYNPLLSRLQRPVPIAPLLTFRILFGGLMMVGALRFLAQGWVEELYLKPQILFHFYGFSWVSALGETGIYLVAGLVALSAGLIMVGLWYRMAAFLFLLSFTYLELLDATNYLNHYYLVVLLAGLLLILPAHRGFSLDAYVRPDLRLSHIPAWCITALMAQIALVYFFAGFAKLNPDWLFRAMPLSVWLPAQTDIPLLGWMFRLPWTPYLFSWAGAFYDLSIVGFLLFRQTRPYAYLAVIVFHGLTGLLFNIGLFPFIMVFNTLIFFPAPFHERLLGKLGYRPTGKWATWRPSTSVRRGLALVLTAHFFLQILIPLRYLAYPGNVLWTEQGYRFAWRVMLVEKAGHAVFTVHDPETGRSSEVINAEFLTPFQEKQMAIQPDLMLQYAHFLAAEYQRRYGIARPRVTVDSHVTLNGRPSRRFIDPNIDLARVRDDFRPKSWILPLQPLDK